MTGHMDDSPKVEKGQIWEARDWRDQGRQVRVLGVGIGCAVENTATGRITTMRVDTLCRYYRLLTGERQGVVGSG